jgi:hypothetical protein
MQESTASPSLNVLVAIPYLKGQFQEILASRPEVRLLLDSGAFTVWKSGKPYPIENYLKFLSQIPITPWRYFTLDEIGNPDGTLRNYDRLLAEGLKPIPIFTRGTDLSMLDRYFETSDLVGIGGLVGTRGNKGFVRGIMDHTKGRQVHWLGFTQRDFIGVYKPYSCDTSSCSAGYRFGFIDLYLGKGMFRRVKKIEFQKNPDLELRAMFDELGENITDLRKNENWRKTKTSAITFARVAYKSWVKFSLDLEDRLGVKLFLAQAGNSWELQLMFEAYDFWMKRRAV